MTTGGCGSAADRLRLDSCALLGARLHGMGAVVPARRAGERIPDVLAQGSALEMVQEAATAEEGMKE